MFGAFSERMDTRAKRRLAASLAVSVVLYGGGVAAVVFAANAVTPDAKKKDKEVEVTFYKAVPEPPPPPKIEPPPPAPEPPPPAPEPPPPPPPKARRGAKPPPKPPKKMPVQAPPEADPSEKKDDPTPTADLPEQWGDPNATSDEGKVYGDPNGKDDGTGPISPTPPAPAPAPPVILPAGATRPEVIGSLVTEADYPRAALAARIEGTVIVKVAVQVDGTVKLVKFIKRDPNFEDAVLEILKRLRFKPAVYNGRPIAVYQNLKFPFTLQ